MSFFNQQAIDIAIQEQEKFQESLSKEMIPIGLNMLGLLEARMENTKNNEPMIVLEYEKVKDKEKYKTLTEYYFFGATAPVDKNGISISAKQLIGRIKSAFGYTFTPSDDLGDILLQIKKFEGTRFRSVIKHEKKLNKQLVEFLSPAISFCGMENDENINEKSFDKDRLIIPLSEYDRQRLAGTAQRSVRKPAGAAPKIGGGAPDLGEAPAISDADDELPF
ncbi:MAG: hypothetical protein GX963_09195 [Bacteroidales bacterium]|nr:hypothetical protein [Bacteroidales bacterium]